MVRVYASCVQKRLWENISGSKMVRGNIEDESTYKTYIRPVNFNSALMRGMDEIAAGIKAKSIRTYISPPIHTYLLLSSVCTYMHVCVCMHKLSTKFLTD